MVQGLGHVFGTLIGQILLGSFRNFNLHECTIFAFGQKMGNPFCFEMGPYWRSRIYDLQRNTFMTLKAHWGYFEFFRFFVIFLILEKLQHFSIYCQIKSRPV